MAQGAGCRQVLDRFPGTGRAVLSPVLAQDRRAIGDHLLGGRVVIVAQQAPLVVVDESETPAAVGVAPKNSCYCSGQHDNGRVNMSRVLLALGAFVLLSSSALAQEKSLDELDRESDRIWGAEGVQKLQFARTVPSGANQRMGFFYAVNPDCTASGDINVRVIKQPEHGKVEITSTSHFPGFSKESNRYKCNQHKVKGVLVSYKPEKYVGEDAFDILIMYPDGYAREVHYDMSVR
jgi:hypothetical protein